MRLPSPPEVLAGPTVPHDVVEHLGIGLAQLRVLLLGSGIWFVCGMVTTLCASVSVTVGNEFELSLAEVGSLVTLLQVGVGLGSLAGGSLGDSVGRKRPIVLNYLLVTFCCLLTAVAASYRQLVVLRLAIGFSIGLGLPPSQTMQSELAPDRMKMVMMMGRGFLLAVGSILIAGIMVADDPTIEHLNLRWCFSCCAVPSAVLGLLAAAFLPESPLYLASSGEIEVARKAFLDMGRLNAFPEAPSSGMIQSIEQMSCDLEVKADSNTVRVQVRAVFGPRVYATTLMILLFSFMTGLIEGHTYAEPLVLAQAPSTTDPGWQILIENIYTVPGCVAVVFLPLVSSRKQGTIAILLLAAVCLLSFAIAVRHDQGVLLEVSTFGLRIAIKCAYIYSHQLATDIYPTVVRSGGTAIDMSAGRVSSMFVPQFFEFCSLVTNDVLTFYYVLAALSLLCAGVIAAVLPKDLQECIDAAAEAAEEALPVRAKEKRAEDPQLA